LLQNGFGKPALGFLEYTVGDVWRFESMGPLEQNFDLHSALATVHLRRLYADRVVAGQAGTAADFLATCEPACDSTFIVSQTILSRLSSTPLPMTAASCKLCRKVGWRGRVPNYPPVASIRSWVQDQLRERTEDPVPGDVEDQIENPMLALPADSPFAALLEDEGAVRAGGRGGLRKREEDPVRLLDACKFATFLRSANDFTLALNAGHRYDRGIEGGQRDSRSDVVGTTIVKVKGRFDIVDCLILRREFEADRLADRIRHITLYSDSSPTTGEELQGQVLDIVTTSGHRRITLPGASLTYGHFDAVNKAIGLLWVCWLVSGPGQAAMEYFLRKVRCLCTDMGVEMHLLETKDCLQAFLAWVGGEPLMECAGLVRQDRRLFFMALRISGWSHSMGNLIKTVLNRTLCWPEALDKIRLLVRFYGNATYRKHIQKMLRGKPVDRSLLDHFDASLATWRYETVWSVFGQLLKIRSISEDWVEILWFQSVQDRELLQGAIRAMKDKPLWRFMAASFREVADPTEHMRRWGMICNCPEHLRQRHEDGVRHIACWRNSRRLSEAAQRVHEELERDRIQARNLAPAQCDGDAQTCGVVQGMLSRKVTELRLRTRYLFIPPWSVVQCNTQEGARAFLEHVARFDMDSHDPLTRHIMSTLGQCIQAVADGGDVPTPLLEEIAIFDLCPLDESAGEGVHRSDTLEKTRAAASSMHHIKQSARERQVLARLTSFVDKHGLQGRRVLRYEFHNWKRILQTNPMRSWQAPKDLKARDALDRIYREDAKAEEDWSAAVSLAAAYEKEQAEKVNNEGQLLNEYLVATLERNRVYSVDAPTTSMGPDGAAEEVEAPVFFRVNDIVHGNSRPHVMPTVESVQDLVMRAPLALNVQFLDPHGAVEQSADRPVVFASADEEWVLPTRIASYKVLGTKLCVWDNALPSETSAGCLTLAACHKAYPKYGPLDKRCPTLVVVWYVMQAGWTPVKALCDHSTSEIGEFDHRLATRMKPYYQALLAIENCIPLTSHMPSQEPCNYYELLLKGIKAEPGQSDREYIVLLNVARKDKHKVPLPLPPVPPPEPGPGDEVILAVDDHEPPSKRKGGGGGPGRRNRAAAKPAPVPLPEPPPPVVVPPPRVEVCPPPLATPPLVGEPSGAGGSSGSGGAGVPPAVQEEVMLGEPDSDDEEPRQKYDWKPGLNGAGIICQPYYNKAKDTTYVNWILKCPRHGGKCLKKRIINANSTKRFGDIECVAYVHAWVPLEAKPGRTHSYTNPTHADVAACVAANRVELQEIVDKWLVTV